MKYVLVTGGCGYCGSVLIPRLLQRGFGVVVLDTLWFGDHLPKHNHLAVLKGSILDIQQVNTAMRSMDAVIHLAGIANDPCGELDPKLTWETNALGTLILAQAAVRHGVGQFIFASSGSVYGIKGELAVDEEEHCIPLTEYNKAKMVAEQCLMAYRDRMAVQIIRPGTVCGASPRQRLDISVNGMTVGAYYEHQISVQGKDLQRANININDLTRLYVWMLERPRVTGIFNAAFESASLGQIAGIVRRYIDAPMVDIPVKDKRSYRINSDKILEMGFVPNFTIENAVEDLFYDCESGALTLDDKHFNLRSMPRQ